MKAINLKSFLFLILVFILYTPLLGQDEKPKDELYILHQDVIKIDKVKQYEDNVKKELELWKKHGMETTVKYASKTDDNKFNFLTPLDSYADLDKQDEQWANFSQKAGEETIKNLYKDYEGTYISHKNVIIKKRVDLSYWPENGRLKGEKVEFLHFDHYYFKEGKLSDGMKLLKEFKELMMKKNSNDGYTVWTSDIGGNIGEVVVVRAAKNNVDYYQESNKRMESVSEELKEMWPRFSPLLKDFSHNNGKPMPEFLYSAGK
jgi:hypothetical protein